jgi:hypothetical protein
LNRLVGPAETLRWDIGAALLLALLVPVCWGNPLYRKMAMVIVVFLLVADLEAFNFEHYLAPAWAAIAMLIAMWADQAWNLKYRTLRVGAALVFLALAWPALAAFGASNELVQRFPSIAKFYSGSTWQWPHAVTWTTRRAALIRHLSALDRPQLVIVRYPSPDWKVGEEWVYNGADFDSQRVIFAHDLGAEKDRALLADYPERNALLLTFDPASGVEKVTPYP